jgi:hypothetical protein
VTAPATEPTTTQPDDEPTHVVCCDPDTALCGTTVRGERWQPATDPTTCGMCRLVEDMPCGNPDCPDRESPEDWA